METDLLVQLPDGTWAVLHRAMDWGELAIVLLLIALVFLQVYALWTRHAQRHQSIRPAGETSRPDRL